MKVKLFLVSIVSVLTGLVISNLPADAVYAATNKVKCVTAPCNVPLPSPSAPVLSLAKVIQPRCVTSPCAEAIGLQWTANPSTELVTSYELYRNGSLRATLSAADLSFKDTVGGSNVVYNYFVRAINSSGYTDSGVVSYTTKTIPDYEAPTAPLNVKVEEVVTSERWGARISWSSSTDNIGVTQYVIKRHEGISGNFVAFYVPASQTSYDDLIYRINTGTDTIFTYSVQAIDAAGNLSNFSNQPTFPYGVTINVAPRSNYGYSGAYITWNTDTAYQHPDVSSYALYRLQDGVLTLITYFPATVTNTFFEDLFLEPGQNATVTYQLYAYDESYTVLYASNEVTITIPAQSIVEKTRLSKQNYSVIRPKSAL